MARGRPRSKHSTRKINGVSNALPNGHGAKIPSPLSKAMSNEVSGAETALVSRKEWLDSHGQAEYTRYRSSNSDSHLDYDEWASSDLASGAYLYFVTCSILENASDSSDDNGDEVVEVAQTKKDGPQDQNEKKTLPTTDKPTSLPVTTSAQAQGLEIPQTKKVSKPINIPAPHVEEPPGQPAEEKEAEPAPPPKKKRGRPAKNKNLDAPAAPTPNRAEPTPKTELTPIANLTPQTPEPNSASPSMRRGLRIRTPAQQAPYTVHAAISRQQQAMGRPLGSKNKRGGRHSTGSVGRTSLSELADEKEEIIDVDEPEHQNDENADIHNPTSAEIQTPSTDAVGRTDQETQKFGVGE